MDFIEDYENSVERKREVNNTIIDIDSWSEEVQDTNYDRSLTIDLFYLPATRNFSIGLCGGVSNCSLKFDFNHEETWNSWCEAFKQMKRDYTDKVYNTISNIEKRQLSGCYFRLTSEGLDHKESESDQNKDREA